MEKEEILKRIQTWEEQEMIYQDIFYMKERGITEEQIRKKYAHNQLALERGFHPETVCGEWISEGDVIEPGRSTGVSKHPRYARMGMHNHEFFEMTYVLEGSAVHKLVGLEIDLQKGDFCIMSPEVSHTLEVFSDALVINILIRYKALEGMFRETLYQNTSISDFFLDNLYSSKKRGFWHDSGYSCRLS